ncbi:hypothetical protein OJF2_71360 [Aquisphaera giovannonii]|uniref:Uncharacterized protein n=1 Tax=Aquisphaera giovannonii TaxID=406548 RepID=A0A5B9WDK1_9BACT|nr:hypothetical protein [Aquisphaera giovannonii]QEH38533.1 hypothetical protein OJF2_71360 [Aquisphaera giovannonii]
MHQPEYLLLAVSAWRYSAAYLLCGGGVFGAIVVFLGAKLLRK